ncbi:TetR/AcrR family transcriptional regulator [uncultured Umboniibacter sp.]|uniref:TetR/AcrR family transcriptional regulator n=1 Tax=uncultured Umboniibacter sp. TaxID=1798917 RepID=UPI002628203A|nr:TetR/AcrR family transcriptional regulator [uncultured Umboniibacter sp.]
MATANIEKKQALRRRQIMERAAAAFNQFGYEGVSIANLASTLGMRSSNIYYYFDTKEVLLRDCYCDSLDTYAAQLAEIKQQSASYQEIIRNFFSFHFRTWHEVHTSVKPPLAMIYEQHLLSPEAGLQVKTAFDSVQIQLGEYFQQCQNSGLLREFPHQAAADFLHAIFDWGTVWTNRIHSPEQISKISEINSDVYLNGVATHYESQLLSELRHLDICEQIIQRAASLEGQAPSKDAISCAATRLFNTQGYEASSIDRICTEVGLTKGAFYHHFKDKNALLKYAFRQAFTFDRYLYQEVVQHAKNGLDAIKLLVQLDAMTIHNQHIQLPLFRLINKLAPEDISVAIQEVDDNRKRFMEFVASGVQDGSMRGGSSSVIAHCYFALKQRTLRFPNPIGSYAESTLDEAWDIFFHGTLKRNA